jgi:thermostable 8-oxoguanine DNA glycosylase
MDMPLSERRQIENEMIFRRLNEKLGDRLGDLDAMHIEDDNLHLLWDDTVLLNFKCECSDEDCNKRIPIKLSVYKKIHENRDAFIIKLRHQVKEIEKVIITEENYCVVEKNHSTAEPNDTLNSTTINNGSK